MNPIYLNNLIDEDKILSILLGLVSIGIAVVAVVVPPYRSLSILGLMLGIIIFLMYTRMLAVQDTVAELAKQQEKMKTRVSQVANRYDLITEIIKIKEKMKHLMKKGNINPMWGVVLIFFLFLLYLIFKSTGVI